MVVPENDLKSKVSHNPGKGEVAYELRRPWKPPKAKKDFSMFPLKRFVSALFVVILPVLVAFPA